MCTNACVKYIKSGRGAEKNRIRNYLASATFQSMRHDDAKELHALVKCDIASKAALVNSFEHLMASSKPSMSSHESKCNLNDVISF